MGARVGIADGVAVGTLVGDGVTTVTNALVPSSGIPPAAQLSGVCDVIPTATDDASLTLTVSARNVTTRLVGSVDPSTVMSNTESTSSLSESRSTLVQLSPKSAAGDVTLGKDTVRTTREPGCVGLFVGTAVGGGVQYSGQ